MAGQLRVGPFSLVFEETFLRQLAQESTDPLRPRVVLVGSNLLGLHLRHSLAQISGGHAGVKFLTFVDLAQALLRDELLLSGRVPFPDGVEEILLADRMMELESSSPFHHIREQKGFHLAMKAAFHDMMDGGVEDLSPAQPVFDSPKLREVARLFHEHTTNYRNRFFTTSDTIRSAAGHAAQFKGLFGTETLYVYGFYDLTQIQKRLLKSLAAHTHIRAYVPVPSSGFEQRLAAVEFFRELGFSEQRISGGAEAEICALSAPGEYAEAEEVVRFCLSRLEAVKRPLHTIGILLRSSDQSMPPFEEVLRRSGLPFYREGGRCLADAPLARSVLALLNLIGGSEERSEVVQALSLFPFKSDVPPMGTPEDWDFWTRSSLVTRGRSSFFARLEFLQKKVDKVGNFVRLLRDLFSELDAVRRAANSWTGFGNAIGCLLDRFAEPSEERDLLAQAATVLSTLEATSLHPSLERVRELFMLQVRRVRLDRTLFERDGIFVGSLASARAIPFELVCIPGLLERLFPALPRPDPLLLDFERAKLNRALGCDISLKETRLQEEKLLFELARSQASHTVLLSYPRVDLTQGKELLPSSFFLDATRESKGSVDHRPLFPWQETKKVPILDEVDWLAREVSAAVLREPASAQEGILALTPLAASVPLWVESRLGQPIWTQYDGIVNAATLKGVSEKSFSPSEISQYAICPYRYYLHYVLKLRPLGRPEEIERIQPMDRGTLLHEILFRFYTELRSKNLLPLSSGRRDTALKLLDAAAAEVLDAAQVWLPVGHDILWKMERNDILADLRALISEEAERETPFIPTDFEVRFGMPASDAKDGERSTDQPLTIQVGRESIHLCGRIDRLDLSFDGSRARIVDYKSGSVSAKDDRFDGGELMQLPIYLSALPLLAPKAQQEVSEAMLLSTSYGSGFKRAYFHGATLAARQKDFLAILATVVRGIRTGWFAPNPGGQTENCRFCDYAQICGKGVGRIFERKKGDPKAAAYMALSEIE